MGMCAQCFPVKMAFIAGALMPYSLASATISPRAPEYAARAAKTFSLVIFAFGLSSPRFGILRPNRHDRSTFPLWVSV